MAARSSGGYSTILLLSAIDLLCAAVTAAIGLLVVLSGTSPAAMTAGRYVSGKGYSKYFVELYAAEGDLPLDCGGNPASAMYVPQHEDWEQDLTARLPSGSSIKHWTFVSIATSSTIQCFSKSSLPFSAYIEILAPSGKLKNSQINCNSISPKIGEIIVKYTIDEDSLFDLCSFKTKP